MVGNFIHCVFLLNLSNGIKKCFNHSKFVIGFGNKNITHLDYHTELNLKLYCSVLVVFFCILIQKNYLRYIKSKLVLNFIFSSYGAWFMVLIGSLFVCFCFNNLYLFEINCKKCDFNSV